MAKLPKVAEQKADTVLMEVTFFVNGGDCRDINDIRRTVTTAFQGATLQQGLEWRFTANLHSVEQKRFKKMLRRRNLS